MRECKWLCGNQAAVESNECNECLGDSILLKLDQLKEKRLTKITIEDQIKSKCSCKRGM